tara:strand:- start:127 stop:699 length:573 start_codon:yes stop_codon:yes gene_type:complete
MASIVLAGSSSGSVTIAAPAAAGSTTLTLPAGSGTIVTTASNETNTPAFSAQLGTAQTLANVTVTKAAFNNQLFDTDNAFDTSTNRFTVPTGKAGIYSIGAHLRLATGVSNLNLAVMYLYKNNAIAKYAYNNHDANGRGAADSIALTTLLDLNAGDYLEIFAYIGGGSSGSGHALNTGQHTVFCGHRLIT